MNHAGGIKAAAKRTAFGDVSNTSTLLRPSKDDSAVGTKKEYNPLEKYVPVQYEKKPTALLRPAQRPLSVSGLKSLFNNVTNSNQQTNSNHALPEVQKPISQTANIRKLMTKRSNTVFKDRSLPQLDQAEQQLENITPVVAPVPPVHRDLAPRKEVQTKAYLDELQLDTREPEISQTSIPGPQEDKPLPLSKPESLDQASSAESDGIYIDNNGEIRLYQYSDDTEPLEEPVYEDAPAPTEIEQEAYVDAAENVLLQGEREPEPAHKHRLTSVSEPEEYWEEEEEEEEAYDEEGYVTARSYKSRGENTTNGPTTLVVPVANQKIKRELAAAKLLIESKNRDELDDETWDTTMVAEYGDEIFQYMKELEVSIQDHEINIWLTMLSRPRCCLMLITWTIRLKSNGRCDQFSWIGWYKFTIVSIFSQRLYSSV